MLRYMTCCCYRVQYREEENRGAEVACSIAATFQPWHSVGTLVLPQSGDATFHRLARPARKHSPYTSSAFCHFCTTFHCISLLHLHISADRLKAGFMTYSDSWHCTMQCCAAGFTVGSPLKSALYAPLTVCHTQHYDMNPHNPIGLQMHIEWKIAWFSTTVRLLGNEIFGCKCLKNR